VVFQGFNYKSDHGLRGDLASVDGIQQHLMTALRLICISNSKLVDSSIEDFTLFKANGDRYRIVRAGVGARQPSYWTIVNPTL
jgi:hypothetical protein